MKNRLLLVIILTCIILTGCQGENSNQANSTTTQYYTESAASISSTNNTVQSIPDGSSVTTLTPTSETVTAAITEKTENGLVTESSRLPNIKAQYKVSNYKELMLAIGSNREIVLLPGNYSTEEESEFISGISDLILTGAPESSKEFVNLISPLCFNNCKKILLRNLNIKSANSTWRGIIRFENSQFITIDQCKLSALPGQYDDFEGSGISLDKVKNFICTNSRIENFHQNIDLFLTENATFKNCTLIGGPLQIGDGINEGPCENIVLEDCTLLCEAGICATWSNYVPIADKSGFEIETGTETWQERRFLTAILYDDQVSPCSGIRYINTYDGSHKIYNDGKLVSLAEKLKDIASLTAFPSVDYIVSPDAEWNQYYNFYGTPDEIKLNINLLSSSTTPDIDEMMIKFSELKEVSNDILNFGYPITIVLRQHHEILAYAEFSNKDFKEFMNCEDYKKWENYCTVFVPYWSETTSDFFKAETYNQTSISQDNLSDLFLTDSIKTEEDFGQIFTPIFTLKNITGYFEISAVQSFIGMGDFMHYNTDLIIKKNLITGEVYLAAEDKQYKLLTTGIVNRDKIVNSLALLPDELKTKITGDVCKDVLIQIDSSSESKIEYFIFLTALDNKLDTNSYSDSQYSFCYYLATYDTVAKTITEINPVSLCSFDNISRQKP